MTTRSRRSVDFVEEPVIINSDDGIDGFDEHITVIHVNNPNQHSGNVKYVWFPVTDDNAASKDDAEKSLAFYSADGNKTETVVQIHPIPPHECDKINMEQTMPAFKSKDNKQLYVNFAELQKQNRINLTEDEKILQCTEHRIEKVPNDKTVSRDIEKVPNDKTVSRDIEKVPNDKTISRDISYVVNSATSEKKPVSVGEMNGQKHLQVLPKQNEQDSKEDTVEDLSNDTYSSSTDLPDTDGSFLHVGNLSVPLPLEDRNYGTNINKSNKENQVPKQSALSYQSFPGHSNFVLMRANDWLKHGPHYDKDGFAVQTNFGHFDMKSRTAPWLSQFRRTEQHVYMTPNGSVVEDISVRDHDGQSFIRSYHTNKEIPHDKLKDADFDHSNEDKAFQRSKCTFYCMMFLIVLFAVGLTMILVYTDSY